MNLKPRTIKIVLAVLLLACVMHFPYGYYQLVRFVAFIGFGILAYHANKKHNQKELIIFISLALLFQPFFKIALGRTLWNLVDVVVGVWLLITVLNSKRR